MSHLPELTWFTNSPDVGDPKCLCSVCLQPIAEEEGVILRMWKSDGRYEARFHQDCIPVEVLSQLRTL